MKTRRVGPRCLVMVVSVTALLAGVMVQPAGAAVTAATGSAYGYRAYGISFFGGPQPDTGPTPTVALASNASNSPQRATQVSGLVHYPPAVLFTSDAINVTSAGALGAHGFVTSLATMNNVNTSTTQPTLTGSEILTAASIASTCRVSGSGTNGATTVTGGIVQTDSGWDSNGDGLYTLPGEHPPAFAALPPNPAPNTTYTGHIHPFSGQTDYFTIVLNEHTTSSGVLTVNAVHEYYGTDPAGNTSVLKGHLILGQSVCGATVQGN